MTHKISLIILMLCFPAYFSLSETSASNITTEIISYNNTIYIANDSELAIISSSGSGTENDPYIIENQKMNPTSYDHFYIKTGIYVGGTTKHFIIRNCEIEGQLTYGGIRIDEVAEDTAQVYNNTLSNCYSGITVYKTKNITVRDNYCYKCELGMSLTFADSVTLTQNNCSFNNFYGIILNNNPSSAITIVSNSFHKNTKYGVYLNDQSSDCLIHHNIFVDNNGGGKEALDNGLNNTWYEERTKEGNYWSQHNSTDPYQIDGSADSVDEYPLVKSPITQPLTSTTTPIPTPTPSWNFLLTVMSFFVLFVCKKYNISR